MFHHPVLTVLTRRGKANHQVHHGNEIHQVHHGSEISSCSCLLGPNLIFVRGLVEQDLTQMRCRLLLSAAHQCTRERKGPYINDVSRGGRGNVNQFLTKGREVA